MGEVVTGIDTMQMICMVIIMEVHTTVVCPHTGITIMVMVEDMDMGWIIDMMDLMDAAITIMVMTPAVDIQMSDHAATTDTAATVDMVPVATVAMEDGEEEVTTMATDMVEITGTLTPMLMVTMVMEETGITTVSTVDMEEITITIDTSTQEIGTTEDMAVMEEDMVGMQGDMVGMEGDMIDTTTYMEGITKAWMKNINSIHQY